MQLNKLSWTSPSTNSDPSEAERSSSVKPWSKHSSLTKVVTLNDRRVIRHSVKQQMMSAVVESGCSITSDEVTFIKQNLAARYKSRATQAYLDYKVGQQKDRLNNIITAAKTPVCKKSSMLSASKAGTRHNLLAAIEISGNKVQLVEVPDSLSRKDRAQIARQGITHQPCDGVKTSPLLGKGGFGKVSLVHVLGTGWMAMKKTTDRLEGLKIEKQMAQLLTKEGVSTQGTVITPVAYTHAYLSGVDKRGDRLYTANFFLAVGENRPYIADYQNGSAESRQRLLVDLAAAVKSLHDIGVTHRDLKFENMMNLNGRPALIDFGLSEQSEYISSGSGTKLWMPKELLDLLHADGADAHNRDSSTKIKNGPIDIGTLGYLFSVLTGGMLESTLNNITLDDLIEIREDLQLYYQDAVACDEQPLDVLIAEMIDENPECRPTIDDVLQRLSDMALSAFT